MVYPNENAMAKHTKPNGVPFLVKNMAMRATRRHLIPIMISQCFAILTQNYYYSFCGTTSKWKTKYKTAKNDFNGVQLTETLNKIGNGTEKRSHSTVIAPQNSMDLTNIDPKRW